MAETFHSINAALGNTADAVIHTNSTSNKQIIILCQVANVHGTNSADVNIDYYDQSATSAKALASTVAVPADVPEATLSDTPVMDWLLNVGAALSTTFILTGSVVNELPSTPAI